MERERDRREIERERLRERAFCRYSSECFREGADTLDLD